MKAKYVGWVGGGGKRAKLFSTFPSPFKLSGSLVIGLTKNGYHTFFLYEKKCLSYSSIQFHRVKVYIYEKSKISIFSRCEIV